MIPFESLEKKSLQKLGLMLLISISMSGCSAIDRIGNIGKAPDLAPIESTRVVPQKNNIGQRPIQYQNALQSQSSNEGSLWKVGSKHFFKDQRASMVGDILTVNITINDQASMNNTTSRTRANSDSANLSKFLGLEAGLGKILPDAVDPTNLVDMGSSTSNVGSGKVDRKESINLTVAAVVTQVLPNGNMVVQGRQEVRVNFEVRELTIMGVIRPEDISSTNTIQHTQIAEARISYGGRGQLTDVQQARYGSQLFDILFPF